MLVVIFVICLICLNLQHIFSYIHYIFSYIHYIYVFILCIYIFLPPPIVSDRSARKIKDYVVTSKLYPVERKVGCQGCGTYVSSL